MYYENNDAYYVGFFCNLNYSNIVKDLIINKCYIIGNCNVGGITGNIQENTKISNCYVSGIIKCEQSDFIGGIVGQAQSNVTIEKCVNEAIVDGKYDVGGIVGLATTNVKVINCKNYGEIKSFVNASVSRNYIGGIVGEGYGNVALHDCYNYGDINCKEDVYWYYIGGIAGSLSNMSSIEKCYNYGSIPRRENTNNNGKYCAQIGGIVGILNKSNIKNVYNYSNIYIRNPESYGEAIAGIVGYCSITEQMQIENVYNYGNIDCNTESSAGLFGKITEYGIENAKLTLINCKNEGNVANGKEITGSVKNTIEVITK